MNDFEKEDVLSRCPFCGNPHEDNDLNEHLKEFRCKNAHLWHECAIHPGYVGFGFIPRESKVGVPHYQLPIKKVCSCWMRDDSLKRLSKIGDPKIKKTILELFVRLYHYANVKTQLKNAQESLKSKNVALDALHYVWCDGGCNTGVHRYKEMQDVPLTEEIVKRAEACVRRLRRWYNNYEYKNKRSIFQRLFKGKTK